MNRASVHTTAAVFTVIVLYLIFFAYIPQFTLGGLHYNGSVANGQGSGDGGDGGGNGNGDGNGNGSDGNGSDGGNADGGNGGDSGSDGDGDGDGDGSACGDAPDAPDSSSSPSDSGNGGGGDSPTPPYVPPGRATPSCTITASQSVISYGGYSILSWTSHNATTASITGLGGVSLAGGMAVYPTTATTYTMTVYGSGGSATCATAISVRDVQTQAPTCSLDASTSSIEQGGSASLYWSTSNATSVTLSTLGSVGTSGSQTVYPSQTTTYVLNAVGNGGSVSCQRTIAVIPQGGQNPYCSIYASPTYVPYNGSTTLYWSSGNGYGAYATIDAIGSVQPAGSYVISNITSSRTFTMSVYGSNGSRQNCSVTVYPQDTQPQGNEPYCSISARGTGYNGQAQLEWNSSNAYSAYITNVGSVATSGQTTVVTNGYTTYTMTVYGYNGQSRSCSTSVSGGIYTPPQYYPQNYIPATHYTYVPPSPVARYVPLRQVPYTGAEDVFGVIFALASALTAGYATHKIRFT